MLSSPTFPVDSPQALARVVALGVVADACVDPREFDALENIGAFAQIGVTREEFKSLARDLYGELIGQMRENNCIELLTAERVDAVLAGVQAPALRLQACRFLAAVISADGRFNDGEFDLFAQVLRRWVPLENATERESSETRITTRIPVPARAAVSSPPMLYAD